MKKKSKLQKLANAYKDYYKHLFIAMMCLGFIYGSFNESLWDELAKNTIVNSFMDLLANNIKVSLWGFFTAGFATLSSVFLSFSMVGSFFAQTGSIVYLSILLIHGVTELLGIYFVSYAGIVFFLSDKKFLFDKRYDWKALKFLCLGTALIIFSAIIEWNVSLVVFKMLSS